MDRIFPHPTLPQKPNSPTGPSPGLPGNSVTTAITAIIGSCCMVPADTPPAVSFINYWIAHQDISDEENETAYLLSRCCRADTQVPPHAWVQQERLEEIQRCNSVISLISDFITSQPLADATIKKADHYIKFLKDLAIQLYEKELGDYKLTPLRANPFQQQQDPQTPNNMNPPQQIFNYGTINQAAQGSRIVETQGGDYLEQGNKIVRPAQASSAKPEQSAPTGNSEPAAASPSMRRPDQFPHVFSSEQGINLYQFLIDQGLLAANTNILHALYILGCQEQPPADLRPICWCGSKQYLREVLTAAYHPTPEGRPLRSRDLELITPSCFVDTQGKPFHLAKARPEPSQMSDAILQFFETL